MRDGQEERGERARRREHHALRERVVEQLAVVLQRGGEERIVGKKQDDELDALLERLPVGLARQLRHVLPHLGRVRSQMREPRHLVDRLCRIEIRRHRRLRVDEDGAPSGQPHHQVGPQHAVFAAHRDLLGEVAMVHQAGQLDGAAQVDLAPAAPDDGRTEGVGELAGLVDRCDRTAVHLATALCR